MVSKEGYLALARINEIQEHEIQKLRRAKTELEQQIEILKKFSILGELFYDKKYLRNQGYKDRRIYTPIPSAKRGSGFKTNYKCG